MTTRTFFLYFIWIIYIINIFFITFLSVSLNTLIFTFNHFAIFFKSITKSLSDVFWLYKLKKSSKNVFEIEEYFLKNLKMSSYYMIIFYFDFRLTWSQKYLYNIFLIFYISLYPLSSLVWINFNIFVKGSCFSIVLPLLPIFS